MSTVLSIVEIVAGLEAPHENILQMSSAELARLLAPDDDLVGRVTELRSFRGRQHRHGKVRRRTQQRRSRPKPRHLRDLNAVLMLQAPL